MSEKELNKLTRSLLDSGDSNKIVATIKWIQKGIEHPLVSPEFKKAWNACDVLVWIRHFSEFADEFNEHYKKYNTFTNEKTLQQLENAYTDSENVIVKEIIAQAIQDIKNMS